MNVLLRFDPRHEQWPAASVPLRNGYMTHHHNNNELDWPIVAQAAAMPHTLRPSSQLVPHDIRITREELRPGLVVNVIATVHCGQYDCTVEVEDCGYCERFARIDTHEAGYVMLCRSSDEAVSRRSPK